MTEVQQRGGAVESALAPHAPEDTAALTWLADAGELASPLVHEVNNFLNAILLQAAVVEAKTPELRDDWEEIRRQARGVAALAQLWQQRRRPHLAMQPVDVNETVAAVIVEMSRAEPEAPPRPILKATSPGQANGQNHADNGEVRVLLGLAPQLPPVAAAAPDLQRLCRFLFSQAAAGAVVRGREIKVQTQKQHGKVVLRVEDAGLAAPPEQLDRFFDPSVSGREGTDRLELAACKSLVKRLRGGIRAEPSAAGGVAVVVELPVA
jgi:signal transduction histidine kinase